MMLGMTAVLSSCRDSEETPTDTAVDNEGKVSVVRATVHQEKGSKIERKNFHEVMVDADTVPEGAFSSIKDVVNKFLQVDVVAGDILVADKVGKKLTNDEAVADDSYDEYVLVTDYTKGVSGDLSEAIQKAIDENPNKTIYFPEGKYNIKKPIVTSADPAKCVSLRLATHAVIIAYGTEWEADSALFELGAQDDVKSLDAKTYLIGGVFQTEKKCNAIEIVGGDLLLNNVSVKQAKIGIIIREGARADVDSCVITGASHTEAIGMLIESEENTFTNMRIATINIGVKLTGSNNVLRNIHPLGGRTDMVNSTGFWDLSEKGNFYDTSYSDQFANSFRLGEGTPSIFVGCFGYWYDGSSGNHYGFLVEKGEFKSIVVNTRISLNTNHAANTDLTYIKVIDGTGDGVVVYPRLPGHQNETNTPDEHYMAKGHLKQYCVTDIMG